VLVIDLGDRAFEVLHLPGHSPGSIGLWDATSGTSSRATSAGRHPKFHPPGRPPATKRWNARLRTPGRRPVPCCAIGRLGAL